MGQYSETIGSFTRTGNYPLEANYIFNSVEELKEFYSDNINKTLLHEGLLKIVKGEKQTLYWVVNHNDELQIIPLIQEDSIDKIFERLAELRNDLNDISEDRIDLSNYYNREEVDNKIKTVIGTAPEALDTLGELADKLSENSDVINAINQILEGKANIGVSYTKSESDAKYLTEHQSLSNYYTKPEVNKLIADTVAGGAADLSDYYTKEEVDNLDNQLKEQINTKLPTADFNQWSVGIEERLNEWGWHEE